jgi:hypothetical protein
VLARQVEDLSKEGHVLAGQVGSVYPKNVM